MLVQGEEIMLCDLCKEKPAAVHLIQVFDGQKIENHLCESCAAQKGGLMYNLSQKFSLPNLLGGMFGSGYSMQEVQNKGSQVQCPNCRLTFQDIKQSGKLGCSQCYQVYAKELESSLRRIHGNSQHLGKIPRRGGEKVFLNRQLEELKSRLQEAVRQEEYEKAADIRDELKEMEKRLL
jgi:protein arginine kinase activator